MGPLSLRLGGVASRHWIDTERTAFGQDLTGGTIGRTVQAFGELGYAFTAGRARVEALFSGISAQETSSVQRACHGRLYGSWL